MASVVFGFLSVKSARNAKDFSGCFDQSSPVVTAEYPSPWLTSWAFHGSPTQNASTVPTFILATICGGGTMMVSTSLLGSMPPAASQYLIHKSCVPPGNVTAILAAAPAAFFLAKASLSSDASSPTFKSAYSLETEMPWPSRLSRAKIFIGTGLFCVIVPSVIRYGIGVRICAPSMPLPAEPRTKLSRVAPHEACFKTSTLPTPYLAKRPFSFAIIKGEESVSAMKPSFAASISGPLAAIAPDGNRARAAVKIAAVAADFFRKARRVELI